ncbi:MAG TPA: phytanoyl-CoA dioxygenase family protein [Flavisolibacter sp.]|jgi:hypothetical protein|nr:phytanoyl-CoA dioxygenase family protein [Flavisolibacter sp.]
MISLLKRMRLAYNVYNLFHKSRLQHNAALYKKLGLKKRYYSSVSSKDFADLPVPENSLPSAALLQQVPAFSRLSQADQSSLQNFHQEGYAILSCYFTEQQADAVNRELEQLVQSRTLTFTGNRIMFGFRRSPLLRQMGEDPGLLSLLSALIDTEAILFQSINFFSGSEQHTHSDSIHMTTYPLGKLIAVWVALEDIGPDNGPLHYYPKSHRLPYYLNSDYGNEGNRWLIGEKDYSAYEAMIEEKIRSATLEKKIFHAKKGDLLIWHANLFHGGEPHLNKERSRKSAVFHYFGKDAICYHEITQRPALF